MDLSNLQWIPFPTVAISVYGGAGSILGRKDTRREEEREKKKKNMREKLERKINTKQPYFHNSVYNISNKVSHEADAGEKGEKLIREWHWEKKRNERNCGRICIFISILCNFPVC